MKIVGRLGCTVALTLAMLTGSSAVMAQSKQADTDSRIRNALGAALRDRPALMGELVAFIGTLDPSLDEADDPETESEEDEEVLRTTTQERQVAFDTYTRAMRAHARAVAGRRTLGKQSRNGKIIEWLKDVVLPTDQLREIGTSLQTQTAIRRFVNPMRRYVMGVPLRYRRYRRERQQEGRWYQADGFTPSDLAPLEVDAILLAILRSGRASSRPSSTMDYSLADLKNPVGAKPEQSTTM